MCHQMPFWCGIRCKTFLGKLWLWLCLGCEQPFLGHQGMPILGLRAPRKAKGAILTLLWSIWSIGGWQQGGFPKGWSWQMFWAAANGGVTNGGLRGVWPPFLEIGRNRPFSPFFCLFLPFSRGCEEHLANPENGRKRPFSSDNLRFAQTPISYTPFCGTPRCSPGTKAGTRNRTFPRNEAWTRVRSHVPPERTPERGHIRQNHPFRKPPFCLPVKSGVFGPWHRDFCKWITIQMWGVCHTN